MSQLHLMATLSHRLARLQLVSDADRARQQAEAVRAQQVALRAMAEREKRTAEARIGVIEGTCTVLDEQGGVPVLSSREIQGV